MGWGFLKPGLQRRTEKDHLAPRSVLGHRGSRKANSIPGPEADGRSHYQPVGLWGRGRGASVQRLTGREFLCGTSIQPISQQVHLTWIAFSSLWKRRISSGPFSMVGMWRCWGRKGREEASLPLLLSHGQGQPFLTLPWYRIRCTGQTWQAVPEPKTSRTRPSSSACRNSFMVILRSATRNSPCEARHRYV